MPLYSLSEAENLGWPPKQFESYFDSMREWSAWYSGDPNELAAFYQANAQGNAPKVRPSQLAGGVQGAVARWFWGTPPITGEKRTKLHAPLPADIAATSARLLFSEPPTVKMPEGSKDTTTKDRLDKLVDEGLHAALREGAEVSSALSGVYLRVVWDKEVRPDAPWVTAVHADGALPEWSFDVLKAVTFWRVLRTDNGVYVRHLERHEKGAIWHGVYEGDAQHLGKPKPLTEYDETRDFVGSLGPDGYVVTGIDKLTVVYVPNIRPNRLWRNNPAVAYCGRSDFHQAEPWFDSLDETYTSWMRDIRLGKARLIAPDQYLTTNGPGKGATFDLDRELYEFVRAMPGGDNLQIFAQQFSIRVEEHEGSAIQWTKLAIQAAGFSESSFGLNGDVAVTATEVAARERKSFITRDDKILFTRSPLRDLLETFLLIDREHFNSGVDPIKPDVEFGDTVSDDPKAVAETLSLIEQARAMSIDTKVRLLHPDWDDPRVKQEVEGIKEEHGIGQLEDPGTFRGGAPDPTPKPGVPGDDPDEDKEPPPEEEE